MRGARPIELDSRRWSNQLRGPSGPVHVPPETYAESLCEYAAGRLDAHGLLAWVVWRLIVDGDLDHEEAEAVAAATVAVARPASGCRRTRSRHRLHRLHRPHRLRPAGRRLAA